METAKRVFVRADRVKEPLEAPYEGPYEVLKRRKKYFILKFPKKPDTVSIDRLKPAYELTPENLTEHRVNQSPKSILKSSIPEEAQSQTGKRTVSSTKINTGLNLSLIHISEPTRPY